MSENTVNIEKQYKKKSQIAEVWHRLKKNKTAVLGLIIICTLILLSLCAGLLFDYDTKVIGQNVEERLQAPSMAHPFGTDELGRDIFARVIYGSRMSLSIGFSTVIFALFVGGFLGAISGYYGGHLDNIIMRFMDILLAIPGTLLAICIVASLGQSKSNLIIALAVSYVPTFARILRSSILSVRDVEYVEAAKAIGAKTHTIITSHVLPNCLAPIMVQTTLTIASAILSIAGLSFIGLGIQAPMPEWGALLSSSRNYIRDYSYMCLFPGLAIMITILSLNLLGDGLRDALDPRLK